MQSGVRANLLAAPDGQKIVQRKPKFRIAADRLRLRLRVSLIKPCAYQRSSGSFLGGNRKRKIRIGDRCERPTPESCVNFGDRSRFSVADESKSVR